MVGVFLGQLCFGAIADIAGRRLVSISTATLTILGAGLSASVVGGTSLSISMQLAICRFILGLGIGGEYPISAAISSETPRDRLCFSRAQLLVSNMVCFSV